MMIFESLANEILHEIFEHLDAAELFRSFHNLNSRFNTIIFVYFQAYRVNFDSVLKYQSDFLPRHQLPLIANKIISLSLTDNFKENPPQTNLFFSYGLQLNQFIHLRSLSLCYIDDDAILRKLMNDCQDLLHLTHLKVIECDLIYMSSIDFANIIWHLPKLIHCCLINPSDFPIPKVFSSSLEYFSISSPCWGLKQVINLLQYTTNLRYLHVPLDRFNSTRDQKLSSIPSITILKLSDVGSLYGMITLLQALPNLTHLTVDTFYCNYDGHQWEKLIDTYLPKLKVFRLRMRIELSDTENNEKLMDTFRTEFWLKKHQWFIRSHYIFHVEFPFTFLYTEPCRFVSFDSNMLAMGYRTTCPLNDDHGLYDRVKNLFHTRPTSTDHLAFIQFSHIRKLSIDLYFNKNVWNNVPVFYQLTSICVLSTDDDGQFHLQSLLDRSPCLYSLTIQSWPSSQVPATKNTNASVRRLDLRLKSKLIDSIFFNREHCETLIHSPLGMQCEELLIGVDNRESILDFVNGMHHLRLLNIRYRVGCPVFYDYGSYNEEKEMFFKWLEDHLLLACVIPSEADKTIFNRSSEVWFHLENYNKI